MFMRRVCVLLILGLAFTKPTSVLAQFENLVKRVPDDTNTLVLIDSEKILKSAAAEKGGWKEKLIEAHKAGVTILPPQAKQAVLASEMDLDVMTPLWQAAIATWDGIPDSKAVAERTGGAIDNVGGLAAVQLPQDAYVLRFDSKTIGFMAPANRQSVGRWVREILNRDEPVLSSYLMDAYGYANDLGTPVIMALDLDHVATEDGIRWKLKQHWKEAGFEGKAELDDVAKVLASIRGATLGVTFKNEPFGALRVDFDEDVAPLAPIAKDLLLHVLHQRGAFINEFEDWNVVAKGKTVKLEGHFEASGLRRVFSVFDRPPELVAANAKPLTGEEATKAASVAYFHSVGELLDDLKRKPKSQGSNYTVGSIALWCDNYARKIDNLPLLNVDPYLLEYGAGVSNKLRQASSAIKQGGYQAKSKSLASGPVYNTYTQTNNYGYTYRSGWLGSGYVPWGNTQSYAVRDEREETAQRARIRTEERNKSLLSAREIIDSIAADTAGVRRQLTQKYQVEFK